jgi:hypothetical protein
MLSNFVLKPFRFLNKRVPKAKKNITNRKSNALLLNMEFISPVKQDFLYFN